MLVQFADLKKPGAKRAMPQYYVTFPVLNGYPDLPQERRFYDSADALRSDPTNRVKNYCVLDIPEDVHIQFSIQQRVASTEYFFRTARLLIDQKWVVKNSITPLTPLAKLIELPGTGRHGRGNPHHQSGDPASQLFVSRTYKTT